MENKTRINIPKLNADDIVEKAALVRVQELDTLINNMVDSLSKASNGKNLSKYWKTQDELIQDVIRSHKEFNKTANDVNATNLLKVVNALKAVHGIDLSDILPDYSNIEKSIKSAYDRVGNLDSAFDVNSFKNVFAAFDTLKAYGLDVQKIFAHFEFNTNVEKLNADLNNANNIISKLNVKVDQLQYQLDESESGNGIVAIREECEELMREIENIRYEAERTFSAFLTINNIDEDSYEFEEYFNRIREGSLTAQEAIAEFKRNYSYLLEDNASFDTSQLQDFSNRLDNVFERLIDISEKIDEISYNGVKVNDTTSTANIEELADTMNKIGEASVSGNTSAIYDALSKILVTIKEIGQVDTDNLYHLYSAIRSLAKLNELKINKSSLDNLADCLERICKINNTSALSSISLIDLQKFNDLHIRKTSLNNLAEYLPQIAEINVEKLLELTKIDFSNLTNLKVDKASLESLRNFADSLKIVSQENNVDTGLKDVEKESEGAVQAKKDFAIANEAVQDSVDDSKSPLQLEAELMEKIAKNARDAADAKKEFVEANKQVEKSADDSNSSIDENKKKDKYAKRNKISEDDFSNNSSNYASIANERLKNSGVAILGETVNTELVNGLVKVSAKIKTADGTWQSFSARIDADGNMFEQRFKTITKGVDKLETELENFGKETSPALTFQETLDKANEIRKSLNLGDDFSIKVDSNELVTITKKLSDAENAGTSVTQTFKSAQDAIDNFGKAASNSAEKTSVALKSVKEKSKDISSTDIVSNVKNSNKEKESIESVIKAKRVLIDTEKEYQLLKEKESDNTATDKEISKLEELVKVRKQATDILKENAINKSDAMLVNYEEHIENSTMLATAVDNASNQIKELNNDLLNGNTTLDNYNNKIKDIKGSLDAIANSNVMLDRFKSSIGDNANLGIAFNNAYVEVERLNNELQNGSISLANYKNEIKNIEKSLEFTKDAIMFVDPNDIEAGRKAMEEQALAISDYKAKIENAGISTDRLTVKWEDQNGAIQKLELHYDKLTGAITATQTQLGKTEGKVRSFSDRIKQGWLNVGQYIASFMSFYEILNAVKKGVSIIRELDTAFTEMRKVSDETVDSLKNFQEASFDIAESVGTTAKQIQNSTADWMRLGESLNEAAESAKVANILLNVSEFENIDDATESLVSMSSAYNELEKIDIVDKLNNIGNNFAISTDGLATALQRSASALKTAGNDMDEAIALVTAGNAVVQNADSVGAGLRTIALRITGTEAAKDELESLGENVDDFVVQTSAKSQKAIKEFTKVASNNFQGFDILDENGNFKSTYEILLGISEIYEEIVKTDKQFGSNMANGLLETLAGKNRANIAASILQNPDILKSVYESSQDSSGSAQEELDKYLDSIEGKIAQLKNEVQEFWYNLISSDTVKAFVDAGIKVMDILGNVVDRLGEIGTLATVVSAGLGINLIRGGRDKKFSLIIKYATESFSREVCEF